MRLLFDLAHFGLIQIVVFGGFFLGVYYFTLYNDGSALQKSRADIQAGIQQTEAQVKKTQQELLDIKAFEKEVLNQEEDVKYLMNFIPSSLTFTDISDLLINEAKSSGVNIGLKRDESIDQKEGEEYHTLNVKLSVNGSFSQILLFLSKLTNQKRILIVHDIDMRVNRQTRLIEADMSISAYRYKGDQEEEKDTEEQSPS